MTDQDPELNSNIENSFTGYNEWLQEISFSSFGDHELVTKKERVYAVKDNHALGYWDEEAGEGFVYKKPEPVSLNKSIKFKK